ncbi:molybdate ABC transporter substrate-binding protein [Vannielia litorea]|uniref:molybdate ABC transporter substrate-binding protein n=1 Tax=Vannielia litorea TaxID=1217970 RepID=UPI001C93A568|nr:molybdate ABC transporter substrate-binding protein [Vannielia litorea]MBY6048053.1 molybdate ABC transporter substrate-binding protein [Vannielia litorea]MBY6075467.1 molybdate ABC transporter substrate-binding protein [Vannielia litorea]
MKRVFLAVLMMLGAVTARAESVTVFAAASLKGALDEVVAGWSGEARVSYAGSSALARQIAAGAPADVFISANPEWVDWLEAEGVALERADLLSNALVLVAGADDLRVGLEALEGDDRVAMALVEAVPAGIYGKTALERLTLWDSVAPRVVQADNVRAALALVALGEAPLGIVYATDALAEPGVRVVAEFPAESHPPIIYPVAALSEAGGPLMAYLQSPEAAEIFARHGFGLPE